MDGEKRAVGIEEATEAVRKKMRMGPEPWPHRYGSAPLTEIWEMGYRDLWDLQHPFQCVFRSFQPWLLIERGVYHFSAGDVKDFVKKIKQEDARIEMRKKQLIKQAERIAAARAKAAALKDGAAAPGLPAAANTVPNSTSASTVATAGSQESLSPSKSNPPSSTPVPLHPSPRHYY